MQGCLTERKGRRALDLVPNEPGRSLFTGLGVSGTLPFLCPRACCSVSGRCEPTEPKSSSTEKDQPLSVSLRLASCPPLDPVPQPAPASNAQREGPTRPAWLLGGDDRDVAVGWPGAAGGTAFGCWAGTALGSHSGCSFPVRWRHHRSSKLSVPTFTCVIN